MGGQVFSCASPGLRDVPLPLPGRILPFLKAREAAVTGRPDSLRRLVETLMERSSRE
jgi:hypothetical protein